MYEVRSPKWFLRNARRAEHRKPEKHLYWNGLPGRCPRPKLIEGQKCLNAARVADADTEASAVKDAFLGVSLRGLADVRRIYVRHLSPTLIVPDTTRPGRAPVHTRLPLKYIVKGWQRNRKGAAHSPKADRTYV